MKKIIKRLVRTILVFLLLLIILILIINVPITHFSHQQTEEDYSNWMSETLELNQLAVHIAMLGAHDAFSNKIDINSDIDPYNSDSIMQGVTGMLVKGFIIKQSVTQISEVETLLNSGVRYLDVRLTYYEDKWYTKHNYLSEEFDMITPQIIDFLDENTGEFLIMDFQHISGLDYEVEENYLVFRQMLDDVGLLDYAYVVNDLATTTYGDITNDGSESKIIILSKFADSNQEVLFYDDAIRSNWADSDDFGYVVDFLETEAQQIDDSLLYDRFRVMQAVTTMQMSGSGILKGLMNWSLINRAKSFNDYLINYEDFEEMLDELPIIMVDYSNSNSKNFNDNIIEIIMDFNQNS